LALEIAERIDTLPRLTVSRFFSGAGLAADGVQFGFVKKGSLYLRVDDKKSAAFEALAAKPFAYAGRSKTVTVASYYEAPREIVDDPDVLGRWAAEAHRAALAAQHCENSGKPERKARSAAGKQALSRRSNSALRTAGVV
jgi:DNA transformation protein and related proteins